jgi:hypothetical protein
MGTERCGNATLEGRIRHRRHRRLTLCRITNQLREEAALLARSHQPIPARLSAELRRLVGIQLRTGRAEGEDRHYLFQLTGTAYLPEEETPAPYVLQFSPTPGGSDGEGQREEGREEVGQSACA